MMKTKCIVILSRKTGYLLETTFSDASACISVRLGGILRVNAVDGETIIFSLILHEFTALH